MRVATLATLSPVFLSRLVGALPPLARQEDPQKSLSLDPANVMKGLESDGQGDVVEPGQVRSKTSSNNFINFCLTQSVAITDGKQIDAGSCNPAPIGRIPAKDKMPSSKFIDPPNFSDNLVAKQPFQIKMKIVRLQTGQFANPLTNYYSAPQQVNDQGFIKGHSHVVIQALPDLTTTEPLDPTNFVFFKGLNNEAQGDILSQDVSDGLDAGFYRMCSINSASNHQPVITPIAQRGSLDDCIYFTVKGADSGAPPPSPPPPPPAQPAPPAPPAPPANLNKFTEKLGSDPVPIESRENGQCFTDGIQLPNLDACIQRACDTQRNRCADDANFTGKGLPGIALCDEQRGRCLNQPK